MRVRKKLGEILVEGGLLTRKQLEEALPFQKKSHLKLGQFLVREGILNESQIVDILSSQLRLVKYRPENFTIDMDLANLLPADIAHKYQAAPLQRNGLLLSIAMVVCSAAFTARMPESAVFWKTWKIWKSTNQP